VTKIKILKAQRKNQFPKNLKLATEKKFRRLHLCMYLMLQN